MRGAPRRRRSPPTICATSRSGTSSSGWIPTGCSATLGCTALVQQGSRFTELDKAALRGVELELLGRVIPAYRSAAARGQVELSTSPFYHPILPLLCDTDVHLRAHPHSTLPRGLFRASD